MVPLSSFNKLDTTTTFDTSLKCNTATTFMKSDTRIVRHVNSTVTWELAGDLHTLVLKKSRTFCVLHYTLLTWGAAQDLRRQPRFCCSGKLQIESTKFNIITFIKFNSNNQDKVLYFKWDITDRTIYTLVQQHKKPHIWPFFKQR